LKVQTPRMLVGVSKHAWGTRLCLKDCTFTDLVVFFKELEAIGGKGHVNPDTNPLETLYVNDETLFFDNEGRHLGDTESILTAGAVLEVSCIVSMDGMTFTRDDAGDIIAARATISPVQVKIHKVVHVPPPVVYVDGVLVDQ